MIRKLQTRNRRRLEAGTGADTGTDPDADDARRQRDPFALTKEFTELLKGLREGPKHGVLNPTHL
jgi:hypothetical protein